jgi:hypothetical protein
MNSRDYYRILYGWDVENYLTDGIRYCAIFVKLTESLNDSLLVQYGNGTKRRVAGMFLFTDLDDATAWVNQRKQAEIDAIDSQIYQLNVAKDKIYQAYAGVNIEEKTVFTT